MNDSSSRPSSDTLSIFDNITKEMFLNPRADIESNTKGYLPHWNQQEKLQFVTFRLADSLPNEKVQELARERNVWLQQHPQPWDDKTEAEYYEKIINKYDRWIDCHHGHCVLRQKEASRAVEDCLHFKDGVQYRLISYVVMPNHVHVMFQTFPNTNISNIVKSWKGVSANKINKQLGLSGTLWQKEYYDTIVRSEKHFARIVRYIEENYHHGGVAIMTPALRCDK